MTPCRICNTPLSPFISFGKMPIANGFLTAGDIPNEYFFELAIAHCVKCGMVQLMEQPEPERMFHERYAFFSSTSVHMARHFADLAGGVKADYLRSPDPFVVEIGSNDGITLQHFAGAGIRHLGIEPSANVAEVAREKGVNTVTQFFDESLARTIVAEHGQADLFLASNVMCHIPSLHSIMAGIAILLKPDGVLVFEDPYLGDIVEKVAYDQIYDEHAFYFCVGSVQRAFSEHGLEVIDVVPQKVHGGSMRYVLAPAGRRPVTANVAAQLSKEALLRLDAPETYVALRKRIENSRARLRELLEGLRDEGKRTVGYAATSKSTTVLNYCGITEDMVEYISDTTPLKHGKLSPGMHIPIRPHVEFASDYPDYALLFGWNHADEIFAKEKAFTEAAGRWIVYVPTVQIVS